MALQVWMPFTDGTLKQQGLKNVSPTIGGTVNLTNAGKLGKCATIGTAAGGITLPASSMTSFTECSVAFWIKIISWNSSYATFFQAGLGSTPWNNYIFGILRNNANSNLCFTLTNSSGTSSSATYTTSNLNTGQWYHLAFTYKAGIICTYIDGELDKTYSTTYVPNFAGITHISIGRSTNNSGYQTNCSLNDFRIYDHCLSSMEVKQISQGLVLHYPLNHMGLGPNNLLYNGFGEFGTENWSSPSNIYDEVPPNHPEIKKSFGNNTSLEYIPVIKGHTYKVSGWIKAVSATATGNVYPSILDYDRDKVQIWNPHCKAGFNLNTMTTLTQQLKVGDTKIYVDSLANWNANSGHYYNYAAIFGYKNSKGYVYPDGVYTQNVPSFGSGTNAKTNLDKTNNIITLNSAYSGPTIPVGTKVCASAAGAAYFYPWGAVNLATISDWTYKEGTFSTDTALRMSPADYMRFFTYSSNIRIAGITITDMTIQENEGNIEYDCSGFCNNGIRNKTFTWTSDTPKYAVSQNFNNNHLIEAEGLPIETSTIACWVKWHTLHSGYIIPIHDKQSGLAIGITGQTRLISYVGTASGGTGSCVNVSLETNTWYHIAVVKTGSTTRKVYINGEEITSMAPNNWWGGDLNKLLIGGRHMSGSYSNYIDGQICDVRAYATALSASDVKSLYQNCATIDPDGTIRGQIRS